MARDARPLKELVIGIPLEEPSLNQLTALQLFLKEEHSNWNPLSLSVRGVIVIKELGMMGDKEAQDLSLFLKQKLQTMSRFQIKPSSLVSGLDKDTIKLEFSDWGQSKGTPAPLSQVDMISDEGLNRIGVRRICQDARRISLDLFAVSPENSLQELQTLPRSIEPWPVSEVGVYARIHHSFEKIQRVVLK